MNLHLRRTYYIISNGLLGLLMLAAFSAVSCQRIDIFDAPSEGVTIRPAVSSVHSTKAAAADDTPGTLIASYPLSDDQENDLVLNVYERDFTELPSLMSSDAEAAGTKGEVMTTAKLTTFQMLAYADAAWHDNTIPAGEPGSSTNEYPAGLYFGETDGIALSRTGSGTVADPYEWSFASDQYWLNEVPMSFWSWNGVKPTVARNSTTEHYDEASFTGFTVAGANGTAVTSQIDPIFAYNGESRTFNDKGEITDGTGTYSTAAKDAVNIHFYHALAAVNFDVKEVGEGQIISNIKLSNIYSQGDCDITVSGGIPQFAWKNRSDKAYFSQAFTASDFNATDPQKGRQPLATSTKVFLMIPQTLESSATITVTFNGTDNVTRDIPLLDEHGNPCNQWLPGKYYTYAIKRSGDVQLDIMDNLMPVDAATVDAHYESVILRFGKFAPESSSVVITDPNGTTQTAFDPLSAGFTSTPPYAEWITFAAPTNASTFAGYPGSSSTVDIAGLLQELAGTGTKNHFYFDGTYYYTQAFINEYVTSGTPSAYVGKNDRKFSIKISKNETTPGTDDPTVVISQKAMQSPYNLTTAANPFGVEVVEESAVTVGVGTAADWCMSRNRDEDGNDTISGSEIKWRTPSLQEYWNIWYGTHGMSNESWLGLSTSKGRTQYLSSDGYAYNGQLSTTISSPSGAGTVRCIRDLGTGSTGSSMSSVTVSEGDFGKVYAINTQNVSSASLRTKITGRELSGAISPGTGTDAADNKLYSKIQVANKYLTWPVSGATQTYAKYEYNLAVDKDKTAHGAGDVFEISASRTLIEGKVKMINPDPRLVYSTSFDNYNGAPAPKSGSEWSYLDSDGVLHFHVEYSGWSAKNSGSAWRLTASIKNADGSISSIGSSNVCSLHFAITKKNVSGPWGTEYTDGPPSIPGGIMIGDSPIALGDDNFRLIIVDGGPYSVQNVTLPVTSELFEGTGEDDYQKFVDYACKNYYYEDTRFKGGSESKSDLGQWRAPNQRELNMILEHSSDLPVMRSMPTGNAITVDGHSTPEYLWSPDTAWATGASFDKISALGIRYDGTPYYNNGGTISTSGSAPYKIRCVRDIE